MEVSILFRPRPIDRHVGFAQRALGRIERRQRKFQRTLERNVELRIPTGTVDDDRDPDHIAAEPPNEIDGLLNPAAFRDHIFRNEHFTVFLPFFTEYPYGVYIFANSHKPYITDFTEEERMSLGLTIRDVVGMFDSLFDYKFPYMMCMHNAPVNSGDYSKDFHFHIEFFPPMRSAEKQKFNASSETGAWAHCNPTCPEDTAVELRAAYEKYKARESEIERS